MEGHLTSGEIPWYPMGKSGVVIFKTLELKSGWIEQESSFDLSPGLPPAG